MCSMISEQVNELREIASSYKHGGLSPILSKAAGTIEVLSAKLDAKNMERSDRYYGGGWVACDKDNLPDKEVLCCDQCGEMILGYISEDGQSRTGFSAENDDVRMYNCVKWMEKPKP